MCRHPVIIIAFRFFIFLFFFPFFFFYHIAGITCWIDRRTLDRKVVSSNPGRIGGWIFFSRVNFVCWLVRCPFHPLLPQWQAKDPGDSAKSAGGRLHLNTHTPLIQWNRNGFPMLSGHSVGTYQGKWAHVQQVRKHSATVVSARWATVDWSWHKEWN